MINYQLSKWIPFEALSLHSLKTIQLWLALDFWQSFDQIFIRIKGKLFQFTVERFVRFEGRFQVSVILIDKFLPVKVLEPGIGFQIGKWSPMALFWVMIEKLLNEFLCFFVIKKLWKF